MMTNYESILATLSTIDANPNFSVRSEADIVTLLRNNLANNNQSLDELSNAEFYAFALVENGKTLSTWGTYFRSQGGMRMDGTRFEQIPIEKITSDIITYWRKRASAVTNPFLKARYLGLVWDLQWKICGTKPDYQTVALPYVNSLLITVNKGIVTGFAYCREKLRRALNLSVSFKNDSLRNDAIQAVLNFQETKVKAHGAGTWRLSYELLVQPEIVKPDSTAYSSVINWLESWFDKALNPVDGRIDVSAAEAVFEPLLEEYIKQSEPEKIHDVLGRMQGLYDQRIAVCSAGEGMHWLEKMRQYYLQAHFREEAKRLSIRIEEMGPRLISEMKKIGAEESFSKDAIDEFVEKLMALPHDDIFKLLASVFLLDSEIIMENKRKRGIHISDVFSKSLHSKTGRKVATIGSVDDDERGRVIEELKLQMTFSSAFLVFALKAGKERNIITVEALMNFIKASTVISPDRYFIIEKAYQAWLSEDYLEFIHLIIPQIEAGCLLIVKNAGGSIYTDNKYGGYNVRLFGDLLREDATVSILGNDGVNYFTTLFSDPRGYNLRNEVAHGLRDYEGFDQYIANATLIAFLHLIASTIG